MAHECPECGQVCYCGGDIDDCLFNFEDAVINCTHYLKCQDETEDDYSYDAEDIEDLEQIGEK